MTQKCSAAGFDKAQINEKALLKYQHKFSTANLQNKIKRYSQIIGLNLLYKVLQLWYVLQKPDVPAKSKAIIMGALGYLISPIDFIPDLTPVLGYNDDAAAIIFALFLVQQYIDEDVKSKAKEKLAKIFDADAVQKLD